MPVNDSLKSELELRGDWIELFLAPRSVAVVGASDDVKAPGGRVLRAMLNYGFTGPIYAVNPKRATVQGIVAFPSVSALPEAVDLAVVVVPAAAALEAIEQCGVLGVPAVLIGSAGFAESGPEGVALQARLVAIAKQYGIRLIGPNTNGIINCRTGLAATFSPALEQDDLKLTDGPIAIVSQSGAIGAALFYNAQVSGLPVGQLLNTGNEIDISLEMAVDTLIAEKSGINVVLCYVEGLRHAGALAPAAQHAAMLGKRIVLLKAGITPAGAQAAAAHTASLAGEDRVYDGVLRQLGIIRAHGMTHLLDIGRILAAYGNVTGNSVSIASLSGGIGIMLADALDRRGMRLAHFSKPLQDELSAWLPSFLGRNNPLDVGGSPFHDLNRLHEILHILDRNPDSSMTILALGSFERRQMEIAEFLAAEGSKLAKPLFVVWYGGGGEAAPRLNRSGVPCFQDPEHLIDALAAVATCPKRREADADASAVIPADLASARHILTEARRTGRRVIDEVDGKKILRAFGIDTVAEHVVSDPDQCAAALKDFRFPVVAKLRSDEIVHKARIGGVRLGLDSADAVRTATQELLQLAQTLGVQTADIVLQEQVESGIELLLGMKCDPTFGPVITLGIGGVLAEVWDDVQIRLADCETEVPDMIAGLRHQKLLNGSSGKPAVDVDAVTRAVSGFCRLVRELGAEFEAIDVNPLILAPTGKRIVAVDCVFFLTEKTA